MPLNAAYISDVTFSLFDSSISAPLSKNFLTRFLKPELNKIKVLSG